jgi:hypothetical protein
LVGEEVHALIQQVDPITDVQPTVEERLQVLTGEERALVSKRDVLSTDVQPNFLTARLRKQTLALVISEIGLQNQLFSRLEAVKADLLPDASGTNVANGLATIHELLGRHGVKDPTTRAPPYAGKVPLCQVSKRGESGVWGLRGRDGGFYGHGDQFIDRSEGR